MTKCRIYGRIRGKGRFKPMGIDTFESCLIHAEVFNSRSAAKLICQHLRDDNPAHEFEVRSFVWK